MRFRHTSNVPDHDIIDELIQASGGNLVHKVRGLDVDVGLRKLLDFPVQEQ